MDVLYWLIWAEAPHHAGVINSGIAWRHANIGINMQSYVSLTGSYCPHPVLFNAKLTTLEFEMSLMSVDVDHHLVCAACVLFCDRATKVATRTCDQEKLGPATRDGPVHHHATVELENVLAPGRSMRPSALESVSSWSGFETTMVARHCPTVL